METRLLDGIVKASALEAILPAGYGYYAHTRGGKFSDTVGRGAAIGAGVETLGSIGDIMKRDVSLSTLTDPFRGALVGGVSAAGGSTLIPLLVGAGKYTNWKKVKVDSMDRVKKILEELKHGSTG